MKVFEFAGVIFNADNICTIQRVSLKGEEEKVIPGLQIVTVAGGVNFSFVTEKERDEKYNRLLIGLENFNESKK